MAKRNTRPRYISGSIVSVNAPARTPRTSDRKKHEIRVTWVTPTRAPLTREKIRENTWKNDGFTAHSDARARLYKN